MALKIVITPRRVTHCPFPELRCTFGDLVVFIWQRIPRDENGQIANTFAISPLGIASLTAPDWTIRRSAIGECRDARLSRLTEASIGKIGSMILASKLRGKPKCPQHHLQRLH